MAFGIDREVLERAAAGDAPAQSALARAIAPHVERQLQRYPLSEDDRRDLLQATLVQVLRRIGSFRGDASFSTWLFRVTANEALMLLRSQRRHRARLAEGVSYDDLAALPDEADRLPEERVLAAERTRRVRHALGELPDGYRDVVELHYEGGLGLHDIARRLAITESAVRSRLHRARGKLRELLTATLGPEPLAA